MTHKDGWKTTEFWMVMATFVLSSLVMLSVITQDDATKWSDIIAPLIGQIVPVFGYAISRGIAKSK